MKKINNLPLTRQLRFEAIEMLAYWEGGLNATRLSKLFGVTIGNITKEVVLYRALYTEQLAYDSRKKVFKPTEQFMPRYIDTQWSSYIQFIQTHINIYRTHFWHADALAISQANSIPVTPDVMQPLAQALHQNLCLDITYYSMTHPQGVQRTIHPIALADNGLRYHCRAFDEKSQEFKDFNLSRMKNISLGQESEIDKKEDKAWYTEVSIIAKPHPAFSAEQTKVLMMEHDDTGYMTLTTRGALVQYLVQMYNLTLEPDRNQQAHPFFIENKDDVEPYLF